MFNDPLSDTVEGTPAPAYLRALYRRPHIEDRFEGIGIHPYSYRFDGVKEQVGALRDVAEAAHDEEVSTWITEIGWASGGIAHPLNKGLEGQARAARPRLPAVHPQPGPLERQARILVLVAGFGGDPDLQVVPGVGAVRLRVRPASEARLAGVRPFQRWSVS